MVMLGNEPQLSWSYWGMSPGTCGHFSTLLQTSGSLKSDHLLVSHSPTCHPRMAEVVTQLEEGGLPGPAEVVGSKLVHVQTILLASLH